MIKLDRETLEVVSMDPISEEERDYLWEELVRRMAPKALPQTNASEARGA